MKVLPATAPGRAPALFLYVVLFCSFLDGPTLTILRAWFSPSLLVSPNQFAQPNSPGATGPTESDPSWGELVLHYRATFLFNLKRDPRFLRFLPAIFPLPSFIYNGSRAEDSAIASALCMRQLAMMYPGYSERGESMSSTILTFPRILNTFCGRRHMVSHPLRCEGDLSLHHIYNRRRLRPARPQSSPQSRYS